jgi:hypothetical protein
MPAPVVKHALTTEPVAINGHCVGDRWTVEDEDRLAKLIAIIAMGQATHAAEIVSELRPTAAVLCDTTPTRGQTTGMNGTLVAASIWASIPFPLPGGTFPSNRRPS